MKYRIIGIVVCVCIAISALAATAMAQPNKHRVHQHLEAKNTPKCSTHGSDKFCTHLPVIDIETDGAQIPGEPISDEKGKLLGYTKASDGSDRITARIKIVDHSDTRNHLDDAPTLETKSTIHVRGNSSRYFDKKGYALNLITDEGKNNPQSVMGMDAHHEWVLHGPFLDKTLMRNYMWYNIAGEIMDYAPNVRFCEAFVNGEYQGVYVMTERITAGENGSRLNLSVDKKDNTYSGYLLCLDRGDAYPEKKAETFTKYALRTVNELEIVYPGKSNITPELNKSITQDFSDFEKALYSYDFDNKLYGYKTLIDVDSFVDFFLINEFTCNYDAGWLSTYIYKDIDKKYRMCIWDFNSACDNYQDSQINKDSFEFQNCLWYWMLLKDRDFTDRIVKRYKELRKTYLSEEYLDGYIDDVRAYLGDAVQRNYERWKYTFGNDFKLLEPADRNPHSYKEAIDDMKNFISVRGKNMDNNIESIRQYSAESKVKKFIENAN